MRRIPKMRKIKDALAVSARSHQFILKSRVSLPKQPVNEHQALTGHIPVMRFAYSFCQAVHTRVHIAARVGGEV